MPRTARIKNSAGIYHVIVRSISDIPLFRSSADKDKYLQLLKKYQDLFLFKVYAYCMMTTHAHLIIDCNGADISKFMKSVNQCYAAYFNRKYNRHGHVFQDRFKSKLISNDKYLLVLSAYIHNNVKDIKFYKDNIEKYRYSSLGIYLGIHSDKNNILSTDLILEQFSSEKFRARELYAKFINNIYRSNIEIDAELRNQNCEYRSERKILVRNLNPEEIAGFISKHTGMTFNERIKYNHRNLELKSICIVVMRSLCGLTYKQIGAYLGNITLSNVSTLCERGLKLITQDEKYKLIVPELIKNYSTL